MIVFDRVTKQYRAGEPALQDVSFHVAPGEFVVVTGPSGAGKTTLLQLVYRELTPSMGRVVVDGRELAGMSWRQVPALRRRIGIVFQDFRLLPRRTVAENVSFVLRALAWPVSRRRERTRRVLEWVGLAHRAHDWPQSLSGGEQQRVAIARALAAEPRLLLADEPTGNLDPARSLEILGLLREIHARGTTVVLATHDLNLIESAKVREIHLRAGRIEEDRQVA
ncbi:MAG: cell division ATP-binding protein FtsE [Acidobacteriota bacterium]|nr:cell division ATP-binding protein FtsE [Acidobacteriota bacterium]MDQ7088750.1 cell division ATP-binding protein FtsE [Acidobacteriota bacterium]